MNFEGWDIRKVTFIVIILVLGVLAFFLIKPVLISIISGLLLAYMFNPAYQKLLSFIERRTIAALLISFFIILIIFIPLWFLVPIMLEQVFKIFTFSQTLDLQSVVHSLFPTLTAQFAQQMTVALNTFVGKIIVSALESLNSFVLDIPLISMHLIIVFFVFFYSLRDSSSLLSFFSEISPFSKNKEKAIIQHFKDITDSLIYGQVIVGIVQGSLAGLGLLLFGVDNVLVLTVLAIFFSILPILGPFIIWIPVAAYLFFVGETGIAIGYLIYNLVVVSLMDNILRTYLVSRKTKISPAIVLVSMIGGFLVFGIMGLLLGPLIVAYFLMFLHSLKEKSIKEYSEAKP